MGWLKKKRDVSGGGTQELIEDVNIEVALKNDKKEAVKRYIWDTSGLMPFSHDIKLHDYLLQKDQASGMYGAWERAYNYSKTAAYSSIGELKAIYKEKQLGELYPMLHIVAEGHDYLSDTYQGSYRIHQEATKGLAKALGLDAKDIRENLKQSIAGEWGNLRSLSLHLGVTHPETTTLETKGNYGSVAYMFRWLDSIYSYTGSHSEPYQYDTNALQVSLSVHKATDKLMTIENRLRASKYREVTFGYLYTKNRINEPDSYQDLPDEVKAMPKDSYLAYVRKFENHLGWEDEAGIRVHYFYRHSDEASTTSFKEILAYIEYRRWDKKRTYQWLNNGAWIVPNSHTNRNYDEDNGYNIYPLERNILNTFTASERERIVQQSLRVSYFMTKQVKVYRGWAKSFLKYGQILLQVATVNATGGLGNNLVQTIGRYAAYKLVNIALDRAIRFAVRYGIISQELGILLHLIVNVGMLAYTGTGFDFSRLMTAPNLMSVVNQSFQSVSKLQQVELTSLQKQLHEEDKQYKDKLDRLKAKQEMTTTGVAKDAHLYLGMPSFTPKVDLFETVEMMYARHYNADVVNLSFGMVYNAAELLHQRQPKRFQIGADINQEIEDVLLIT